MTSKRKNKKRQEPKSSILQDYAEVCALVAISISMYLGLSLYSHHPLDPSLIDPGIASGMEVQNLGGLVGSYISSVFMFVFGFASFGFALALLYAGIFLALKKFEQTKPVAVLGWSLLIVTGCLFLNQWDPGRSFLAWGGWLGVRGTQTLTMLVGEVGLLLVMITSALVSMHLLFGSFLFASLQSLFAWLGRCKEACVALGATCKDAVAQAWFDLREWMKKEDTSIQASMTKIQTEHKNVISIHKPKAATKDPVTKTPSHKSAIPIVIPKRAPQEEENELPDRMQEVEQTQVKSAFRLPQVKLLEDAPDQDLDIDQDTLLENAARLEEKLKDFGVMGKVKEVQPGPVVTMYEFEPAPGVKVNKITSLGDDLTLALRALSVRIALIPGKSVIGIEVANPTRQVVFIKDIIADKTFQEHKSKLAITLGKDISGHPVVGDLRKMPHLLVAGATGSGKSVSINSMLVSVLCKATPEDVRMILVDPKMLELSLYDEIPHLLLPVVTDPRKASAALKWAVREMEKRYRLMADLGVRNIEGYNAKVGPYMKKNPPAAYEENMEVPPERHEGRMPFIMIVIDELADLMMVASKDVEDSIIRLAQMARASGIHLLLATQRPSVDVITGVIKANMPSRISFKVSSKIDSRTILDANGAEQLLGAGDMLYMPPGTSKIARLHGSFISDEEVDRITSFWKEQAKPEYNEEILKNPEGADGIATTDDPEEDEMYRKALEIVKEREVASISYIQRRLRIGYNRAARLVERMEADGFLAPGEVGKPREVLTHQLP